jgi:subtilase family serine protease
MHSRKRSRNGRRHVSAKTCLLESLESRLLLSAAAHRVHPGITVSPSVIDVSQVRGSTPAQIRKAYGIDQFTFGDQTVPADGSGQTICIVDPYNDPNIRGDLGVFDAQFGIAPPPNFAIVNQSGGSNLPATSAIWANEISIDVEWAHAVAPGADILLVEAVNDNPNNVMTAIDYARHVPSVSVISLSIGENEFAGERKDDPGDGKRDRCAFH